MIAIQRCRKTLLILKRKTRKSLKADLQKNPDLELVNNFKAASITKLNELKENTIVINKMIEILDKETETVKE